MKRDTIRQDMLYPHPPQRVWTALTDPAALAKWLLPNDFVPRLGHRFTFKSEPEDGWSGLISCEVVELVPLQRLAFSWSAHPHLPDMLVTFTLEPVSQGTHLRLEQRELASPTCRKAGNCEDLPSLRLLFDDERPAVARFFRIEVDEEALTDALFDFVTDSSAARNNRPVVREIHAFAPEMISVLENMVLDGVTERHDIADYIHFVFGYFSA